MESIAESGHITALHRNADGFAFRRIGRRDATTFSGFCQRHDSTLFREIDYKDIGDIDVASKRQLALHFLRAVSIEFWKKKNVLRFCDSVQRRDHSFQQACAQLGTDPDAVPPLNEFAAAFAEGTAKGLEELGEQYDLLSITLAKGNFDNLIDCSFVLKQEPTFVLVSGLSPHQDLFGSPLYHFHEMVQKRYPMPHMALFVLPHRDGTVISYTVLRRHRFVLEPLLDQLRALKREELQVATSRLIVNHCENIAFKPSYIATWTDIQRDEYLRLFRDTIVKSSPLPALPPINLFA